jgi:hypothetical protein
VEDGPAPCGAFDFGEIVCFWEFCEPTSVGMTCISRLTKSGLAVKSSGFFEVERQGESFARWC